MAPAINYNVRVTVLSFVLFCTGLFLTAYSSKNPEVAAVGSGVMLDILKPLQSLNSSVTSGSAGLWDRYVSLIGLEEENQNLKSRLTIIEAENSKLRELESENQRLRTVLNISEATKLVGVVADVIGHDLTTWGQYLTIDKGSLDGVKIGMPVIEGNGVVGQVVSVGFSSSQVLLVIDSGSGVDALVQSSRARGVVSGAGNGKCELRYVSRDVELKIGDRLITSGQDGVYPKGIQIGIITEVEAKGSGMFQQVELQPVVDFSRLESVLIVTNAEKIKDVEVQQ